MVTLVATDVAIAQGGSIYQATMGEPNPKTPEVSTEEVRRILVDGSAMVVDSRSHAQFVAGHIPGVSFWSGASGKER
jgi:3-mercaptopyruvate sulfurtransferase SseA